MMPTWFSIVLLASAIIVLLNFSVVIVQSQAVQSQAVNCTPFPIAKGVANTTCKEFPRPHRHSDLPFIHCGTDWVVVPSLAPYYPTSDCEIAAFELPYTARVCKVDETVATAIPEFFAALNHSRNNFASCSYNTSDVCVSIALKSHESNIRRLINDVLDAYTNPKCNDRCHLDSIRPGMTLDDVIPEEFRCNMNYISQVARGKVLGDMVNVLSAEQKFVRYICYLSGPKAIISESRESLFVSYFPNASTLTLTPYMEEEAHICNFNDRISCKTLSLDVNGVKSRVGTCACSDYDAIERQDGKCLGKPLTPCRFKVHPYGKSFLSDNVECVKHSVCRELDDLNLKERFSAYYTGLYQNDFIKEFIMDETTHACDCQRGYDQTAAGNCINAAGKPSRLPLLPLFTIVGLGELFLIKA